MPAQDGQFAGDGNCRDLMAASGADTQKERNRPVMAALRRVCGLGW
jgi:hypothetical protein